MRLTLQLYLMKLIIIIGRQLHVKRESSDDMATSTTVTMSQPHLDYTNSLFYLSNEEIIVA